MYHNAVSIDIGRIIYFRHANYIVWVMLEPFVILKLEPISFLDIENINQPKYNFILQSFICFSFLFKIY